MIVRGGAQYNGSNDDVKMMTMEKMTPIVTMVTSVTMMTTVIMNATVRLRRNVLNTEAGNDIDGQKRR
eukprot:11223722-Lingulodinium_polyedra.AAC.1